MQCDLHIHTTFSDGSATPAEVVRLALGIGLGSIAITDHDSVDGCLPAMDEARGTLLRVFPGVEMMTSHAGREVHLLGYGVDPRHPELLQQLRTVREERNSVARQILDNMRRYGFAVDWDQELSDTAASGVVGKNHLLLAVRRAGYIRSPDEAMQVLRKYLAETGLAYVRYTGHAFAEGVRLIRRAGGAAVLAHPGLLRDESLAEELAAMCDGLEVFYCYLGDKREYWVEYSSGLARRLGLLATGGSDYHGAYAPVALGQAQVPEKLADRLSEFCGMQGATGLPGAGKGEENA